MPKIEVTDVMVDAGVSVYRDFEFGVNSRHIVETVFRAMLAASKPKLRRWKAIGVITKKVFVASEYLESGVRGRYGDDAFSLEWDSTEEFLVAYPDAVEVTEGGEAI